MKFQISDQASFREWECPIYGRAIDEALCYELSNIGILPLPECDRPPCSASEVREYCDRCRHYKEWA